MSTSVHVEDDFFHTVMGSTVSGWKNGRYVSNGQTRFCYLSGSRPNPGLLPISLTNLWHPMPFDMRRSVTWLPGYVDDPDGHYRKGTKAEDCPTDDRTVRCISSKAVPELSKDGAYIDPPLNLHMPMFDVDIPHLDDLGATDHLLGQVFQADRFWIPSTTNWHVYIGTPGFVPSDRGITWGDYETILTYLSSRNTGVPDENTGRYAQFIDSGWAWHSRQEQNATLRDPSRHKNPPTATVDNSELVCMWCAMAFHHKEELEAHEEGCV